MQLEMFRLRPRARKSDPETSHVAAARAGTLASKHHRLIVAYLKSIWPNGAICDEIADGLGGDLTSHQISRRMKELAVANEVYNVPGDNRQTKADRPSRVWRSKP